MVYCVPHADQRARTKTSIDIINSVKPNTQCKKGNGHHLQVSWQLRFYETISFLWNWNRSYCPYSTLVLWNSIFSFSVHNYFVDDCVVRKCRNIIRYVCLATTILMFHHMVRRAYCYQKLLCSSPPHFPVNPRKPWSSHFSSVLSTGTWWAQKHISKPSTAYAGIYDKPTIVQMIWRDRRKCANPFCWSSTSSIDVCEPQRLGTIQSRASTSVLVKPNR